MLTVECEIGTFGKGCSNRCSSQCLDNVPCNLATGHCDKGCATGYVEPFCNKSMNVMYFHFIGFITWSKNNV